MVRKLVSASIVLSAIPVGIVLAHPSLLFFGWGCYQSWQCR